MDCSTRKELKLKGGNKRDKETVMAKVTMQKTSRYNNKKVSLVGKSSGLTPFLSSPGTGT
jgi:cell shape-determining protein MreC